MELVLLRHGKAEERALGLPDELRNLTEKGRQKTLSVAKGLTLHLKDRKDIEVWASPALRSSQTAEIIASTLGNTPVEIFPAIYSGLLDELSKRWRKIKSDKTIIVIGHEPHLSIWSRQLGDVNLHFKKCAAACFEIDKSSLANLKWFAGPKALIKLGKTV